MKRAARWIALLLLVAVALSLVACGEKELGPEKVEKKDYSEFAGIVADPATWVEEFEKLPIANENMTTDELRQLACDAFKANMTFQWTPNIDIKYNYELLDNYKDVLLLTKQAYSGFCYATGIADATNGTLYKVLPFYDKETGVLDVEAMGDKMLNIISSACSNGVLAGWNRVTTTKAGMTTFNPYDSPDVVLVGPYTYQPFHYNHNFKSRTCTKEIIQVNGDQTMYESYACMLPADGLYSASAWHVMMCSQAPVVVRNADGTINPEESYLHVHEQGQAGTRNADYDEVQSNGVKIRMMGTVDNKKTFAQLLESGYIPFTLKVFTGENPPQAGKAWIGEHVEAPIENGTEMTITQLFGKKLFTNYVLCTLNVVVKNPAGEELVNYNSAIATGVYTTEAMLSEALQKDRPTPYANGKNTIHLEVRLSNGELIEAFNTVLKAD